MASLLELEEVSFAYGEKPVFEHISYRLEPGTLCCLMGQNGCGKSTLLDCILGEHVPQQGKIRLLGREIQTYRSQDLAKQLSYVPQVHQRSFPYTVRQIVLMGRTAHSGFFSGPDADSEALAEEALALVGISALAERPYTQISGGEMQLTLLARALVQQTPLILMDEPTAHLDFRNELIFLQTVVRLMREKKTAVLLATHSPNQPFYFANQGVRVEVAAMRQGALFAVGAPKEVLTEENIRKIYGIEALRLSHEDEVHGELMQIVPVQTWEEGGN